PTTSPPSMGMTPRNTPEWTCPPSPAPRPRRSGRLADVVAAALGRRARRVHGQVVVVVRVRLVVPTTLSGDARRVHRPVVAQVAVVRGHDVAPVSTGAMLRRFPPVRWSTVRTSQAGDSGQRVVGSSTW